MMWHTLLINLVGPNDFFEYLSNQTAVNFGGYDNWKLPNRLEFLQICYDNTAGGLSYEPFAYTGTQQLWTNQTVIDQPTLAYVFSPPNGAILPVVKTNTARRAFYNRLATYTKNPVTGVVTIN
jgi:hypothetical protein